MSFMRTGVAIHLMVLLACGGSGTMDEPGDGATPGLGSGDELAPGAGDPGAAGTGADLAGDMAAVQPAPADPNGAPQPGPGTEPAADESPYVLSVSPTDGAVGVAANAAVIVKFSQPMDIASVNAALASDDLPPSEFTWSDDLTTLTVTPSVRLAYGQEDQPRTYTLFVRTTARDAQGRALKQELETSFSTLRSVSGTLPVMAAMAGMYALDAKSAGANLYIGDDASNDWNIGYLSFDLGALPDGLKAIEKATLVTVQDAVSGTPYDVLTPGSSGLRVFATHFAAVGENNGGKLIGDISNDASLGEKSLETTSFVNEWMGAEATLAQFMLMFSSKTDKDGNYDRVRLSKADTHLAVTYLVP